jgi:hypothetical protein
MAPRILLGFSPEGKAQIKGVELRGLEPLTPHTASVIEGFVVVRLGTSSQVSALLGR